MPSQSLSISILLPRSSRQAQTQTPQRSLANVPSCRARAVGSLRCYNTPPLEGLTGACSIELREGLHVLLRCVRIRLTEDEAQDAVRSTDHARV